MRRYAMASVVLSTALFSRNQPMAAVSDYNLSMWQKSDAQMVDLIGDGYMLNNYSSQSDKIMRIDKYFLQKGTSLFQCTDMTVFGDMKKKGNYTVISCQRLVRPYSAPPTEIP